MIDRIVIKVVDDQRQELQELRARIGAGGLATALGVRPVFERPRAAGDAKA